MAHNLEIKDGTASFVTAKVPAWHQLGVVTDHLMSANEAYKLSRADFELEKVQLINPFNGEEMESWGIFRTDNHAHIGTVGARFEVTQPKFIFDFMDKILRTENKQFETAGVLGKGEKVFALANVEKFDLLASGDIHNSYLLGVNAHNGSMSVTFKLTETRVVCQNTLNVALGTDGTTLRAKNMKNGTNKLNRSLNLIQQAQATTLSVREILEELAQRKVNSQIVATTIANLFGVGDINKNTEDIGTATLNQILTVKDLFESNDNDAFKQFRGTGYNLLNAITEFADHHRNVRGGEDNEKQRAYSAMFGSGDTLKQKALKEVLEAVKDAPTTNQQVEYSYSLEDAGITLPS